MKRAVWKFHLGIADSQLVEMPLGAQLLDVQVLQGQLVLWALVLVDAIKRERRIGIYATGYVHEDIKGQYVTTVQTFGGDLVWHVFDEGFVP